MATLIDAIINIPDVGNCQLNLDDVIKFFDKHCFITKNTSRFNKENDTYRLVRMNSSGRGGNFKHLKLSISENDALFIINSLSLVEVRSMTFRNASSYYHKEHADLML